MSELLHSPLALASLRTIDLSCDAFESAWGQGRRPLIEHYLGSVAEAVRPMLQSELLRMELEWRYRQGEEPTEDEYRARFPSDAASLADWLAEARRAAAEFASGASKDTAEPGAAGPGPVPAAATASAAEPYPDTIPPESAPPCSLPPLSAGGPPSLLGEYEVLGSLGAGGMGEVYRARHRHLGKLVALKVLPLRSQGCADVMARFRREMKAVGTLDHPNLVEAYDGGEQAGVVYLVMKLIDGTDLSKLVKEGGPLPVAAACAAARQVAAGLQYLAERGLVHRDLKPSNLMRTPDGTVKILDFGLARWQTESLPAADLTVPGAVMGTPAFMAPEQARGETKVDLRADLYALGGTLFFLLTGRAPFADHQGVDALLEAQRTEEPPDVRSLRPEVPAGLAAVVGRLLAKKPADRFQTPAEVADALAEFTGGSTPNTTQTFPPVVKPTRPRRLRVAAIAAACVLTAGLGLALLLRSGDPPTSPDTPPSKPLEPGRGAPDKLVVEGLDLKHWANVAGKNDQERGLLGEKSFVTRRYDSVDIAARLSRPAYAYLIAFRPDGQEEMCFPESEDLPPPLTNQPRYPGPEDDKNYGLKEGEGLWVFAVVASSKQLPSYKEWRSQCKPSPWKPGETPVGVVWWDDGEEVLALTLDNPTGKRSKGHEVKGRAPVAALRKWLRQCPGVEAVGVKGFAALPKMKP